MQWEAREKAAAAKRTADADAGAEAEQPRSKPAATLLRLATESEPPRADGLGKKALLRLVAAVLPMRADGRAPDALASFGLCASLLLLGLLFYYPALAYQGELAATEFSPLTPALYAGSGRWSITQQQAYTIYARPLWALGLCVMLFLCATRRGGALGAALGASFWRPVATLAFGAYLYHPVVLYVLNLAAGAPPRYSPAMLATTYAATCVFSVLAAAVSYVLIEAPAAALEKVVVDAGIAVAEFAVAEAMKRAQRGARKAAAREEGEEIV